MATSQYSYLRQYSPYVSPYNVDVIKDVMLYKQQKVDANRAKMYSQIDYLMGQSIAKPEDRAYLESRLSDAINRINIEFDGADLSSDGVTRAIQGEISGVLDTSVMNAIAGTREYQRFMEEVEDIKKNHPERYSHINEYVSTKPFYNWYNDGKVGSRLGSMRYIPYVDVQGEINKLVKDFREMNKGKVFQVQKTGSDGAPTGAIIEATVDQLTERQIYSFIDGQVTPEMREQLRINAEYLADTNPVFKDPAQVGNYMQSIVQNYDRKLSALNARLGAIGDNKMARDLLQSEINETKNQKARFALQARDVLSSGSPYAAAQLIVTNNLYDNIANAWAYENNSYKFVKDEIYFTQQQEERDKTKFVREMAKMDLDAENQRIKNEQERLRLEYMRTNPNDAFSRRRTSEDGSDDDGGGGGGKGTTAPTVLEMADDKEMEGIRVGDTEYQMIMNTEKNRQDALGRLQTALMESGQWDSILNAAIEDNTSGNMAGYYNGMTEQEMVAEWVDKNGGMRNEALNSRNNAAYEAFTAWRRAKNEAVGQSEVLNEVSKMQEEALFDGGEYLKAVSNAVERLRRIDSFTRTALTESEADRNRSVNRYYRDVINKISSDDSFKRMYVLASAIVSGGNRRNGFLGLKRRDGRGLIGMSLMGQLKNISKGIGSDFDINDWVSVDSDGSISFKQGVNENSPIAIQVLSFANDTRGVSSDVLRDMGAVFNESINVNRINEIVSPYFNRVVRRSFVYTDEIPATNKQLINERTKLKEIIVGMNNDLNPDNIRSVRIVTRPNSEGALTYYLQYGYGLTSHQSLDIREQQVSTATLAANGFNMEELPRNFRTDTYRTGVADAFFVDTTTKAGKDYNAFIESQLGLYNVSTKQQVYNSIESSVARTGIDVSSDVVKNMMSEVANLINLSDYLGVRLVGNNDRGRRWVDVEFIDKRSGDVAFVDEIDMGEPGGEYADSLNDIYENAPQYFFAYTLTNAVIRRAEFIKNSVNNGSNPRVLGTDLYGAMFNFYNELFYNAGANNQQQ